MIQYRYSTIIPGVKRAGARHAPLFSPGVWHVCGLLLSGIVGWVVWEAPVYHVPLLAHWLARGRVLTPL